MVPAEGQKVVRRKRRYYLSSNRAEHSKVAFRAETTEEVDRVLTVALVVIGRENCSASSSTRR